MAASQRWLQLESSRRPRLAEKTSLLYKYLGTTASGLPPVPTNPLFTSPFELAVAVAPPCSRATIVLIILQSVN